MCALSSPRCCVVCLHARTLRVLTATVQPGGVPGAVRVLALPERYLGGAAQARPRSCVPPGEVKAVRFPQKLVGVAYGPTTNATFFPAVVTILRERW